MRMNKIHTKQWWIYKQDKFGEQNKSDKTDKLVYIKLKNFCSLKDTLVALDEENNTQEGWNICQDTWAKTMSSPNEELDYAQTVHASSSSESQI